MSGLPEYLTIFKCTCASLVDSLYGEKKMQKPFIVFPDILQYSNIALKKTLCLKIKAMSMLRINFLYTSLFFFVNLLNKNMHLLHYLTFHVERLMKNLEIFEGSWKKKYRD